MFLLFLSADGGVKKTATIYADGDQANLGDYDRYIGGGVRGQLDKLGGSLAAWPDADGDGVPELAVGKLKTYRIPTEHHVDA